MLRQPLTPRDLGYLLSIWQNHLAERQLDKRAVFFEAQLCLQQAISTSSSEVLATMPQILWTNLFFLNYQEASEVLLIRLLFALPFFTNSFFCTTHSSTITFPSRSS
jgi:hypothetical protein